MIRTWLASFTEAWQTKNIPQIMSLFTDSVEYWETPFVKLSSRNNLENEWQVIKSQQNIVINTEVISHTSPYVIQWHLMYNNPAGEPCAWSGVYIIRLKDGLCDYFYQVGEKQ